MNAPGWPEKGWHYRRSLASRVILLTTIAVGFAVALVALAVFLTVRMQMQSSLDQSLLDRARQAATAAPLLDEASIRVPSWATGAADVRIIFLTPGREPQSLDEGPDMTLGAQEYAVASRMLTESIRTISAGGEHYRVAAVPTTDGRALILAQSLESQEQVLSRLGPVMLLFGLAGVVGAAAAGWGVARNGLRPVRRLTAAVEEKARTEELAPLPIEGDDEIARLATAFNAMLAALEASRDRQRRLVADAGHELRTPLTSLRTNLDLLTQADETGGLPPEQKAELLEDVRAQIEELSNLVGDLVELARDEPPASVVGTVELHEVLDHAVARVRRRAPSLSFVVDADPWYVEGDAAALERALTNLLDNAAKWSPAGGTVHAALHGGTVTVDDEGDGIPEADVPHVFERFYRSADSRAMPGSGLGLSIVAQVTERHAGTVEAGRAPSGGTRMTLRLPGAATPKPAEPPAEAAEPATTSERLTI